MPLQQELQALDAEYQKITGAMTAEWEGETVPLARLRPFLFDTDRATRKRALSRQIAPYVESREALARIFDEQYRLRQQVAKNAGFDNFRDYSFRLKNRFDYSPADCETFHDAVEASVVPAIARRNKLRKAELGVSQLRPWDVFVDPAGRPGLKPFDNVDELAAGTEAALGHVSPIFGTCIATMRREKLLDLDSREGKAPGGYCTGFDYRKRPFIFMNAAGTHQDVETMLHEGGHAVHAFEAYATLPLIFNRYPGEEMAEVGSMAMELLASPYLEKKDGGFYSTEDANRARIEHLEGILSGVAWIATVDAFQHWIYTDQIAATPKPATPNGSWSPRASTAESTGAGSSRESRPLAPPAAHLPVPVLLHRIRYRPARRAAGLAKQPGRSGRCGRSLPECPRPRRHQATARAFRGSRRPLRLRPRHRRRTGRPGRIRAGKAGGVTAHLR